jgi:hypothetical protein
MTGWQAFEVGMAMLVMALIVMGPQLGFNLGYPFYVSFTLIVVWIVARAFLKK